VDYVAQSIVWLAQQPSSKNRIFHLCCDNVFTWADLGKALALHGYPVQPQAYEQWLEALPTLRGTGHPLESFIPFFLEKSGQYKLTVPEAFLQHAHPHLSGELTRDALRQSGIISPAIDFKLWGVYLDALCRANLIPNPSKPEAMNL
jgi:hypothetical protein